MQILMLRSAAQYASPSKNLKVLRDNQGYGSRDQAEQALKGLSCKALPG